MRLMRWFGSLAGVGVWVGLAGLLAASGVGLQAEDHCRDLKGAKVVVAEIGLPTSGAVVKSAKRVGEVGGGYCRVYGEIGPVDRAAQPIRFALNLPATWNGKAVQFGGGAFDGYLKQSDGRGRGVVGVLGAATPLERGYATFGSDAGHHHHYLLLPDALNAVHAEFALNVEQRRNFAQDSLKKTHDVAVALIRMHYGRATQRMYFLGGSTGGREALKVVQNWPQDYDGVLAAYAAWDQIESDLQFIRVSQALYAQGDRAERGWLPTSKTKLVLRESMAACDAQDGLRDGMISDVAGCHFEPEKLMCADGKDHRGCLSKGQLRTVETYATAQVSDYAMVHGMRLMPGYNVLAGANLRDNRGLLRRPMHRPFVFLNSFQLLVGDGVLRYFLTRDKAFDALKFDVKTGGKWRDGILEQSLEDDASDADLTVFERRGGKLLLVHGTADATIPTNSSVAYYQRVVKEMGQARADGFMRLYLLPGFAHGYGTFNAGFDGLGVLDSWAEKRIAPAGLVMRDGNKASKGRTRPMCEWPLWAKYRGSGDVTNAGSFVCVDR